MSFSHPSKPPLVHRYVDGIAVRHPTFYPDSGGKGWYPELQFPTQTRLGVRFSHHMQKDVYVILDEVVLVNLRNSMDKEDILYIFRDFGKDIRVTFFQSHQRRPYFILAGVQFPTPRLAEQAILFANDHWQLFGGQSFRARYKEVNAAGPTAGSTKDILLVREEFALTPPFTDSIFESHQAPTTPPPIARPPQSTPPPLPPLDRDREPERSTSSSSSQAGTSVPWNAVGYARDGFQGKRSSPSSDEHDRDGDHTYSHKKRRHDQERHDHGLQDDFKYHDDFKHNYKDQDQGRKREREQEGEMEPSKGKTRRRSSRWDVPSTDSRQSLSMSPSQHSVEEGKENLNLFNLNPDSTFVGDTSNSTDDNPKTVTQYEKEVSVFSSDDLEKLLKACEASTCPAPVPASTSSSALPSPDSVLDENKSVQSITSSHRDGNQKPISALHKGNVMPLQPMRLIVRISSQSSVSGQGGRKFFDFEKEEGHLPYEIESKSEDSGNNSDSHDRRDSPLFSPSHSLSKNSISDNDTRQVPVPILAIPSLKDFEKFVHCFPSGRELCSANLEPRWVAISNDGKQLIISTTENQLELDSEIEVGEKGESGEFVKLDSNVVQKWAISELPTEIRNILHLKQSWSFSHTVVEEKWKESKGRMVFNLPQLLPISNTRAGTVSGTENDVEVMLS